MAIYLNDEKINVTMFPDKTSQVWKLSEKQLAGNVATIFWDFENEAELLHLAQLSDLIYFNYSKYTELSINYLPYARQDKDVSNDSTFALHSFSRLLNSIRINKIIIHDPHSDKVLKLIRNSVAYYSDKYVESLFIANKYDIACYPDKGATQKYKHIYSLPFIYADKVRDQLTGNILGIKIHGECKDKKVLIVDDICDGGGTFILLAKQLKEKGAKEVDLFVTHGLFTKGLQVLKENGNINKIYTPDGERV
jgi:ribose-phosphate pyrophosphokinase